MSVAFARPHQGDENGVARRGTTKATLIGVASWGGTLFTLTSTLSQRESAIQQLALPVPLEKVRTYAGYPSPGMT